MRAFVVGNIVMDETFAMDRIPGEGESVLGSKVSSDLGGKATNQAILLARSGIATTLIAGIGRDANAARIRARLAPEPVSADLIELDGRASDTSIILTDGNGGNVIVTTVDCARALPFGHISALISTANPGDLLVLQGNLTLDCTAQIMDAARTRKMRIAHNPSPYEAGMETLLPGLDILFLNEHEAGQITGRHGRDAVRALLDQGIETVVLTLGAEGALLGNAARIVTVPAQPCDVIDSTGAGDTLQSVAIAASILHGTALDESALQLATKAAALTVSRPGTTGAFPTVAELSELLGTTPANPA